MAKLKGLLKIEGTLDELTFYKTQDGNLVRTKGGVSAERIANDPAFARTRENGSEFGSAASAGKLLRNTVRPLMMKAADNRVTSRLTQVMTKIKDHDTGSQRGDRVVGKGITHAAGLQLLKGFNFNDRAVLGSVLFSPYSVVQSAGEVALQNFVPINDLAYPTGATHVTLRSGFAIVDFVNGTGVVEISSPTNLPIDGTVSNLSLKPNVLPVGNGTSLYLLMIEFFQEVNGIQYSLKNGAYNVLAIVDAA